MYQTIHEKIAVIGVYNQGTFVPRKFQWQRRVYPVAQVTLTSDYKDGGVAKRMYSVASGANVYRLLFDRQDEQWFVEEVWCE